MNIVAVFMIGLGLSMDACAVSFAKGMCLRKGIMKTAITLGFWFGLFQGAMPLLGWWIGTYFQEAITAIDHWIAFILLGFIGLNMIREAFQEKELDCEIDSTLHIKDILVLAVATSIDALAVGISFAFLQVDIVPAVLIIGITTFVTSMIAVILGKKIGGMFGKYAEILGGCILIIIGLKILVEHLLG